ncbi:MAG: DUF2279 domain-containing protein [Bacteroidota bacterium]
MCKSILWFLFFSALLHIEGAFAKSDLDTIATTDFQPRKTLRWLDPKAISDANRTKVLVGGLSGLYAGSMTWLYTQWYSDYSLGSFRTFNDGGEWEGMDKYAHAWDAYSISKPVFHLFRWAGYDNDRSAWYGAGISTLFQTTVEVFDGFSPGWGFSFYDIAANTGGTALFLSQQLGWKEQRIVLKYSFHTTQYAALRPDVLGSNLPERILKDYNGLTYWVSVNPSSFLRNGSSFPSWLSLAIGFGAEGMTGGDDNPTEVDGRAIPAFDRYRQYYLGIDFDLARIKTRHRLLQDLFKVINIIRLPAPAIEFAHGRKTKWHPLYF